MNCYLGQSGHSGIIRGQIVHLAKDVQLNRKIYKNDRERKAVLGKDMFLENFIFFEHLQNKKVCLFN